MPSMRWLRVEMEPLCCSRCSSSSPQPSAPRGHTSSEDEHGCFGCSGPFVPLQKPTGSFQTSEEM